MTDKPLQPLLHLLPVPAHHTTVIYGECRVGDHQFLVDANDSSETLTLRTGAHRRVEGEHLVCRLFESHPISLELHRKVVEDRWGEEKPQFPMPLVESCLCGIDKPRYRILAVIDR